MSTLPHPRALLVEFFGAFLRKHDDWMPVSVLVTLMSELGLDEQAVRTLVSRLKRRSWLIAERRSGRGGYRLSETALHSLQEGDRIVWHARQHVRLADGWALVTFSVPEKQRDQRYLLRSRLSTLGFGRIGSGMWIAPARMLGPARSLLEELGLDHYADLFVASYAEGQDLDGLIRRGWDLDALNDEYQQFILDQRPVLDRWLRTAGTDGDAFRDYMLALNQWRRLPFTDPGLPAELLGDSWAGDPAGALFEAIVDTLQAGADRHVDAQLRLATA